MSERDDARIALDGVVERMQELEREVEALRGDRRDRQLTGRWRKLPFVAGGAALLAVAAVGATVLPSPAGGAGAADARAEAAAVQFMRLAGKNPRRGRAGRQTTVRSEINSGYTLYFTNKTKTGAGGFNSVCRSPLPTSTVKANPCMSAVNHNGGRAFELRTNGSLAGSFKTKGTDARPFELSSNSTGMVQYLNSDQVDGKDATAFANRHWAVVGDDGGLRRTQGATASSRSGGAGSGQYQVTFNQDVDQCSYTATVDPQGTAGRHGTITAQANSGTKTIVNVFTYSAGTTVADPAPADLGFNLQVIC